MRKTALIAAGTIFLLVAIGHLVRLAFRLEVVVAGLVVPLWPSVVGVIVALSLSLWMFGSTGER
jgi:uncharacterized membrane protein